MAVSNRLPTNPIPFLNFAFLAGDSLVFFGSGFAVGALRDETAAKNP
jgi:hypothetical protein